MHIRSVQMTSAGEPTQHAPAYLLLECGEVFRCQRVCLGKVDLPVLAHRKHPVDHAAVEVHMVTPQCCSPHKQMRK